MKNKNICLFVLLTFIVLGSSILFISNSTEASSVNSDDYVYSGTVGTVDWNLSTDGTLYLNEGTLPTLNKSYWKDYASLIKRVVVKGNISAGEYLNYLFDGLTNLTEIENLDYIDTSKTTRMMYVFRNCYSLKTVSFKAWDTSKVVTFTSMFNGCRSLISLDLSSFNTKSATSYVSMFNNCSSLTYLNISSFSAYGTTSAVSKYNMFDSSNKVLNTIVLGDISPFTSSSGLPGHTETNSYGSGWIGINKLRTYSSTAVLLSTYDGSYPDTYVWTPKYSVMFDSNNGSGDYSQQYFIYGVSSNLEANSFIYNNKTFLGWNTQADGSGENYSDKQVVSNLTTEFGGNITLYAQWTANNYTVAYDANTGAGTMADQTFTYDVAQNLTTNSFTKDGYTFSGWSTKADGTGTAYTNESEVKNLITENGEKVTLYAQWTANNYSVAFNANTGSGIMTDQAFTYDVAQNLTTNSFIKDGYTFSGWSTKADGTGTTYTDEAEVKNLITENVGKVTLYAQWTANKYTVSYDSNTGSGTMADQSFTYDVAQNLTTNGFTKTGYTFTGWSTTADGTGTAYINGEEVTNLTTENGEKVTLYARWTANQYIVTFNANGGTGLMADQAFTYDVSQNLSKNLFTRTGYTFTGWSTVGNSDDQNASIRAYLFSSLAAESATYYSDEESVMNLTTESGGTLTLYTQWSVNQETATVTYIDDTTGDTLSTESLTGNYGTTDAYRTADAIASYVTKGYELVSDNYPADGVVYDQAGVAQSFEVHLKHATTLIDESHTVKQTIQYVYSDGATAVEEYSNSLVFNRTNIQDDVTTHITYGDWTPATGTFESVTSPTITGYTTIKTKIDAVENVTGDSEDILEKVIYTANQETANVTYIDDTTGETLSAEVLTGAYGTTDAYRTADTIASYVAKGYELVSDNYPTDGVVYDQAGVTQSFKVHLKHGTTTTSEEKTVTQTIHYVYSNGTTASPDVTATLGFSRTVTTDKVTKDVTNSAWFANDGTSFTTVTSPTFTGYTADYLEIAAVENVTGETADLESTVTYTANQETATVTYIDDTTGETLSTKALTGAYGTTDAYRTSASIATYVAAGYELVSDNYPTDGVVYNQAGVAQTFEVHLKHITSDKTETKTVNQTIHYVYSDGKTATNDYMASLSFIRTATTDATTGEITYGDWTSVEGTTTFVAVNSPSITGYTPNQSTVAAVPNVTSETDNLETTVTYVANTETATVTYIDDTTGEILSVDELAGAYGTTDTYQTKATVASYEAQNYAFISDDYPANGVVYDQAGVVKHYEVHFEHVTTTATEAKSVNQTIHYVYSNGKTAANDYAASLDFYREVITDEVTGETTYGTWEAVDGATFEAVDSPNIVGYKTDKATIAAVENVTGSTSDIEDTVTYSLIEDFTTETKTVNQTIQYVYSDGTTAADTYTAKLTFTREVKTNNTTGEKTYGNWVATNATTFASVTSLTITGYTADKPTVTAIDGITGNTADITIIVKYTKNNSPSTGGGTTTSTTSATTSRTLPQAGEEVSWTIASIGVVLLGSVGYVGTKRRKEHK